MIINHQLNIYPVNIIEFIINFLKLINSNNLMILENSKYNKYFTCLDKFKLIYISKDCSDPNKFVIYLNF